MTPPALEMASVMKGYGALRPLRIRSLAVPEGEAVAIAGIDGPGAEAMINLITGASLPDQGEVRVFGRRTADVADGDEWLASLDRFGIVSERAVLLEAATLAQNLALPLTLEIDPLAEETRGRVRELAAECGIEDAWLDQPAAALPAAIRIRGHLARALALGPRLLLMEHPAAGLAGGEQPAFGMVVRRVAGARGLTVVMISKEEEFSRAAAGRRLTLEPATGSLREARRSLGWFR